ncbi:MAG: PilZ domain-containing protein [Planctomycetia bacterium]|nr:PilZ domain-containing protein [Planctomycetia bacterium]
MASGKEQRQFRRLELSCAIMLVKRGDDAEVRGRTVNVSDGGACFLHAEGALPSVGEQFQMKLAVPRQTPNTYFLEHFVGPVEVMRVDESERPSSRIAIRFDPAMPLDIV